MSNKLDYNKKMIGQKVKVIENNITWIGEIKETVNDDSFLIRDSLNRDNIVSMYDIRSVDMAQLSQV
jgi:hypothetical protein|tara:strand:+ start:1531 stop:1731 length:201 start_codon:yes stop_codon:yes gene_type:complete